MKDTFHGWASVGAMELDVVTDLIVTGRTAREAMPDEWMFKYIGSQEQVLTVLDFGCGIGRNAFGMSKFSPNWTVIGYDNDAMLSRVTEFSAIHYDGRLPRNLWFVPDWEQIRIHRVDCILCSLVLQHIYEDALVKYIQDFKQITKRIVVIGRRFNDDAAHRSTWAILEEQGLVPEEFYSGEDKIPYVADGDPSEHNLAIYTL